MVLDNRYSGKVFVRAGATGHLFNQHYLDVMFPIPGSTPQAQAQADGGFLDRVVDVDEKTATKRESAAAGKLGGGRRDSGFEEVASEEREGVRNGHDRGGLGEDGENGAGFGGFSGQANRVVWAAGKEARGKTTRELSRLWMYLDGGDPVRRWNAVEG